MRYESDSVRYRGSALSGSDHSRKLFHAHDDTPEEPYSAFAFSILRDALYVHRVGL